MCPATHSSAGMVARISLDQAVTSYPHVPTSVSAYRSVSVLCAIVLATVGCGGTSTLFIPATAVPQTARQGQASAEVTELPDADLRAKGFGKTGYVFVTVSSAPPTERLVAIARAATANNDGELLRIAYVKARSWKTTTTQYTCQTTGVGTGLVQVSCGNVMWNSSEGRATLLASVWRRDVILSKQAPVVIAARFKANVERLETECREGTATACRNLAASGVPDLLGRAALFSRGCELGDRHACRLAAAAELVAHRPRAAEAAADRGCSLGSGSTCAELDANTPRARIDPRQAVSIAAKSCEEGDFYECEWLTFALGRREPLVKDDAKYRTAERSAERLAAAGCRADDLEICARIVGGSYGGKKAAGAQLEAVAGTRCSAGDIGACAVLGHALLFEQTERARAILEETCEGGAPGSCWDYGHALRISGRAAPLSVELQRRFARSCEHGGAGCKDLESIAEGSLE